MSETRYYTVAEHLFSVTAEAEDFGLMGNYEPFAVHPDLECGCGESRIPDSQLFALTIGAGEAVGYTEETRQVDEEQEIICGSRIADSSERCAVFEYRWLGETAGWLVCSDDYREGRLITTGRHKKLAIDNALMVLFALATADKDTVLFHAAVVSHEGRGYMFLGPSGTGKSTHARLWLENIAGTELVNDDNPVVRRGVVYGSPWSGKTPCYRHVNYPLGGIVVLSQAPHNKIWRLSGLHAYTALVASISGMRWDARIADGLHRTENALASSVPTWHLECLPNEEAAILCRTTIIS